MHLLLAVVLLTTTGVAAARADGARVLELWLPLPREEDQAVLALRLDGTAAATVVHLAPSGDRAAYLRVAEPKGTVTLTETATVARREVQAPVAASRAAP